MKKKIVLIIFVVLLSGCGKKQKDFFVFSEKEEKLRIKRLSIDYVKRAKLKRTNLGNQIIWDEVFDKDNTFIGYNLYRLTESLILPKKPLNKIPFYKTSFLDTEVSNQKDKKYCYVIKKVFKINGRNLEGPCSKIFCV